MVAKFCSDPEKARHLEWSQTAFGLVDVDTLFFNQHVHEEEAWLFRLIHVFTTLPALFLLTSGL